jgi:acetyl/propionyl-CoA carboxylase alpha subunit
VLEETPSPAVDDGLREAMSDAAVAFGRAVGYRSAGTAEFMVDDRDFYFLELNGRIQVEHPVTELVTGVDIVEQQIRIARGEPLAASSYGANGHAVEVRLYAEDPQTFLPQTGRISRLELPSGVRVDAGVAAGDEVGRRYDPLIAKLIAHGATRSEAFSRLSAALRETTVEGVTTNLPFLRWLVAHPRVLTGQLTTAFLVENPPLSPHPAPTPAAWHGAWRLNGSPPSPSAPPDTDQASHGHGATATESTLAAQMPGTVLRVLVSPGDAVTARQPLLVLEAMKMETPVVSPHDATVRRLLVAEGDQVAAGTDLVELDD